MVPLSFVGNGRVKSVKTVDVISEWPLRAMCDDGIVCRQPENDTIHLESSRQWPFLCTLSDGISFDVRTVEIVLSNEEMTLS